MTVRKSRKAAGKGRSEPSIGIDLESYTALVGELKQRIVDARLRASLS